MRYWQYWAGRHLVHLGLFIMPRGVLRTELFTLFEAWVCEANYQIHKAGFRRS